MFEVLGRFNEIIVSSNTLHIADRLNRVDECTKGSDIVVDRFIVDKGHKNGAEIHEVYSDSTIKIYNLNTLKLITILFARPAQIKRYYEAFNEQAPELLIKGARLNSHLKRNMM